MKMNPKEKRAAKEIGQNLQLEILLIRPTELLVEISDPLFANNSGRRHRIYNEYEDWNGRAQKLIAEMVESKKANIDYLTKWLMTRGFGTKEYSKLNIPMNKQEIVSELNELKSIIKEKKAILDEIKNLKNEDIKNSRKEYRVIVDAKSWDDIEMRFKNEFDLEIYINKKFLKKYSNEGLGFYSGAKGKKPDRQWQFLILLSTLQGQYEKDATKDEMALSLTKKLGKKITINNCEQIIKSLSAKLSKIFGINNPFYSYKEWGYFKPKFTLTPIPIMRKGGEVYIKPHKDFNDKFDYKNSKNGNTENGNTEDEDGFQKI